ncbi:hypothetical protein [Streptomyces chryseus]
MLPETVTTAEHELTEARALLDALTERVRDGDPDITPDQLAAQRELIGFAELRVTAAQRKHAAGVAADREQRGQAIGQAARELLDADDTQPILDAVQAAVDALRHLARVAGDRNDSIASVAKDVVAMNEELRGEAEAENRRLAEAAAKSRTGSVLPDVPSWPVDRFGVRAQTWPASVTVLHQGRTQHVHSGELAAAALHMALLGDAGQQERARVALAGQPNLTIGRVTQQVPGLADALRYTLEEWQAATPEERRDVFAQGRQPEGVTYGVGA